jgi:hypothetical protein
MFRRSSEFSSDDQNMTEHNVRLKQSRADREKITKKKATKREPTFAGFV